MPRKKKDGRHINYYIDRKLHQRLERYAEDNGQSMTTALERILKEHLDRYAPEEMAKPDLSGFCSNCNLLVPSDRCPLCGNRHVRPPKEDDYCYLTETESIWAGALSDVFSENQIPFLTKNWLGIGLAAKIGPSLERVGFYVPFSHYAIAKELEEGFFSADIPDQE